MKNVIFPRF